MRTRTLWVHCGTLKTGTSTIQNLAWAHRELLLKQGWLYPETGLVTSEPGVGYRHSHFAYQFRDRAVWERLVADLVVEIRDSVATGVLLSSEGWSRPMFSDSLAELVDRLRAEGVIDNVQGVVYLRNRVDYARALYREFTRRRANRVVFADFVDSSRRSLDVLETVTALRAAVGSLVVVPYEEVGDTGAHLFGLLGLTIPNSQHRANVGIGPVRAESFRQLNLLAPELAEDWPGPSHEPRGYAEALRPGQLVADSSWQAKFGAASGWSDAQVQRLVAMPKQRKRDVTELAATLHGEVRSWLTDTAQPSATTSLHPHPMVADLVVREVDGRRDKPWISGFLLLAPEAAGWRLVGVDDYRERDIPRGLPSPAFAVRHPDRPEATTARWGTSHFEFGLHGRIELQLAHEDGRRVVLAVIRRQWSLRDRPT